MPAHTDKPSLNALRFSQSTPTFFYPMQSVYLTPVTYPSPLKPSLHHPSQPLSTPKPIPFNTGDHHLLGHTILIHFLHMPKPPQHTLIPSTRWLPFHLCSPPNFLISYSVLQCQPMHTSQTAHLKNIQLPPLCFCQAPGFCPNHYRGLKTTSTSQNTKKWLSPKINNKDE